jgi:hypothetical protein
MRIFKIFKIIFVSVFTLHIFFISYFVEAKNVDTKINVKKNNVAVLMFHSINDVPKSTNSKLRNESTSKKKLEGILKLLKEN